MTYIMYKTSDKVCDSERDGTELIVMDDWLYSFGGWTADPVSVSYNTIYRTKDLITWEQVFPSNPMWKGRHTFGCGKLGPMVLVYGSDAQSATGIVDAMTGKPDKKPLMDIWITYEEKEGKEWTNITGGSGMISIYPRCLYGACGDGAYLYMIGGMAHTESFRSPTHDVWRFDGNMWKCMGNGLAAFEKNLSGAACYFNKKLWVISGDTYGTYTGTQEVYSSDDYGANWRREPDIPFPGRQYHNTIVWDNKLWLIGGVGGEKKGNLKDIYSMDTDGIWWQFYDVPDEFLPRHASGVCVYNNKLVIANGNYHNDCWVIEKIN